MHVLTTKTRPGSVSEAVLQGLRAWGFPTIALPPEFDVLKDSFSVPEGTQVLVNTIGVTDNNPVGSWTQDRMDRIVRTNLLGPMLLTEAFLNQTSPSVPRLIIHVGSTGSRKVFTNCAPYCASKAGLAHYVTCAGFELRDTQTSIIGIHPDNILGTPMTQSVQKELIDNRGMKQEQVDNIYKRAIPVEVLAQVIVDLVRDTGSWKFKNGENLYLGSGCKRGY